MKILNAAQVRELDAYTIEHEPIPSIDLMERAAEAFVQWFTHAFFDLDRSVFIFCGPGNNGGDGLAIARLLQQRFYDLTVFECRVSDTASEDYQINRERLPARESVEVQQLTSGDTFPDLPENSIVIDGLFGSGLNRPVEGYWAELLSYLNAQPVLRIAIDIPSGLFADRPSAGVTYQAHHTFSFQLPKLSFFFPENDAAVGDWTLGDIGLDTGFIARTESPYFYLDDGYVRQLLRPRRRYDHKGTYGHALLMVGSYGKVGAAILAARACLRSGAGLLTIHAPSCAYAILQQSVPEAMVSVDRHQFYLSETPRLDPYQAVGIGPGIDQRQTTAQVMEELLLRRDTPLVIDADGLNLLAQNKGWLDQLPKNSILTPHPKEFERLFGPSANGFEQLALQREEAQRLGIVLLLKGAHTRIALPDGSVYFNATGNPGMATGGTGDVLTGMLTGLLAQGYTPAHAAQLGVYLHGLSGDLAAEATQQEAIIAGDLIEFLGHAYRQLRQPMEPTARVGMQS